MKKYFLFFFLFSGFCVQAQTADTAGKGLQQRPLITSPATIEKLEQEKEKLLNNLPAPDENKIREEVGRSMDTFLQVQKEQKAKQKKAAMIRIGIGLAFLVLLVIGWRRRRK